MVRDNNIGYLRLPSYTLLSWSRTHRFVRLSLRHGFHFNLGMIRSIGHLGRVTLHAQDLGSGREYTVTWK